MNKLIILLSTLFLMFSVSPNLSAQEAASDTSKLGQLNWGINPANGLPWTIADLSELSKARTLSPVGKEVRNILRSAHNELEKVGAVEPNELPRSKLRGIGGMGTIIMPPHPALSHKGRGNIVTPKQSFEEPID